MMINQELVKRVKEYFDLNIYETKVWLALLSKGIVSAGETAEISGVPRSRTYDVLESLAKRGFAIVKVGKPVRYIAVDPNTVIEKMKINVIRDAENKANRLLTLRDTQEYSELQQLHKAGITPIKSEDISGFMKGRSNILSKIKEIISNSQKEFSIYTSVTDFEDKLRILLPAIEDLQKKEVKVRITLSGEEDKIRKLNNKYGLKARSFDKNTRFYIADKREALFMINPENAEEQVAIWLNAPFFSQAIHGMFEGLFKGK